MNDFIKMLKDANVDFEIEGKSVTVRSYGGEFLIFDFDEDGKLTQVS